MRTSERALLPEFFRAHPALKVFDVDVLGRLVDSNHDRWKIRPPFAAVVNRDMATMPASNAYLPQSNTLVPSTGSKELNLLSE
jgi:hypothetical protein